MKQPKPYDELAIRRLINKKRQEISEKKALGIDKKIVNFPRPIDPHCPDF